MFGDTLTRDSVIQHLKDMGCPEEFISRFLTVWGSNQRREQLRLLSKQRGQMLDQLHDSQKRLDRMDLLIYTLEKDQKQNGMK